MLWDVVEAKYVKDYKLNIKFEDGRSGIVDLRTFPQKGGIFSKLKDPRYFKRFYINTDLGTICWPDNQDIAPETLYSLLRK